MHGQHGDMLGTGARVLQYCTAPVTHIQGCQVQSRAPSSQHHPHSTTRLPHWIIDDQDMSNIITVTYDTVAQPRSTLLVRVNNYGDNTFTNGDMLNISYAGRPPCRTTLALTMCICTATSWLRVWRMSLICMWRSPTSSMPLVMTMGGFARRNGIVLPIVREQIAQ